MKITETTKRALGILAEQEKTTAREFARKMWPDSAGWMRMSNCGPKGATRGKGMYLCGGSYLRKLCRAGLAQYEYSASYICWYSLSGNGKQKLKVDLERRR